MLPAALLAWVSGCSLLPSWTEIDPPPPKAPPSPPLPPTPVSRLSLPIHVDMNSVVRELGALLPDSLAAPAYSEDFGTGGPDRPACGVACGYRVLRDEAPSLRAEGRMLEVTVGIRYGFACQRRIPCFGPRITASCGWDDEPNRLRLRFTAGLEVREDWTTSLRTHLDSLDNQGACRIRRLPIHVPDRLLAKIYNDYDKAGPRLDSLVNAHLALRSRVETAWRLLSRPIPVGKDAWIVLNPKGVTAPQPHIDGGILRMDLGLTARPRVFLGAAPEPELAPLPDIGPPAEDGGFRLHVPVVIGYAEIDAILRKRFRLDSGGIRVPKQGFPRLRVDRIKLSEYGDRVLVQVHFHGAARGKAFLIGKPRFDPETYELTVEDLDFELHTLNPLLTAAKWLKREEFTEAIESRIVVMLKPRVDDMKAKVLKTLGSRFQHTEFDGKLDRVVLKGFRFSDADSALTVLLEAAGRLEARVEG